MAAAAVMVSSPSSLLGGEISANQAEKSIEESKPESSEPKSDPIVQSGDDTPKDEAGNNIKIHVKQESSTESSTEKPVEFSDTTKKPPRMSSVDDYTMLPEGYVPKDEDVICSWARQNHSHPGNEKFRVMINEYAPTYLNVSTKYQKSEVIAKIVAEVRSKSPGGGFVKKDFYSNRWFEVGDEKARDKVGHAIRKAAVGLGKKLHGNKRQPQSLAKRQQMKNKAREFDQMNALNMNPNDFMNKAALMNAGMNLDNGFSGLSNDMGLSSMNMNMNMGALNRNPLMGVSNMRNTTGIMGAMGMNGMGMNSIAPMSYSRELEEMLVMNRLRSEVAAPGDSSLLGSLYNNSKQNGDSGGLSGLNMMTGMDDSAMLEELQRRRLRLDAAAKKEEAMNMLRDSERMSRWADKGNNNKSSLNDASADFNNTSSGLNNMNGGGLGGNGSNSGMGFMGMSSLGGASGNLDSMNGNNLDSMATSSLLSKLASGNGKMSDQLFMQGASNFGNSNSVANSLMNNLNNNLGSLNDSMGDNNGQLPVSTNGLGQQSLNQIRDQYNYDMP
jgi:hypothetical protein